MNDSDINKYVLTPFASIFSELFNRDKKIAQGKIFLFHSQMKSLCINLLPLLLITLLSSCSTEREQLTSEELHLIREINFDEELFLKVAGFGESIERLVGVTPEYEAAPANGLILNTGPNKGHQVLSKLRSQLKGSPYSAYLNEDAFGFGSDKIAIIKSNNDFDYLEIVRTDGINYELEYKDVLRQYKKWNDLYGLKLKGAGQSWLEAEFIKMPDDWKAFAEEVYEFCPDVVDQGSGDIESLANDMKKMNAVYLWWD